MRAPPWRPPEPRGDRRGLSQHTQRNHDALNVIVRASLMSGELGSHQELPVTITATATLEDLQNKTGVALMWPETCSTATRFKKPDHNPQLCGKRA